jgi:hypothetical protein
MDCVAYLDRRGSGNGDSMIARCSSRTAICWIAIFTTMISFPPIHVWGQSMNEAFLRSTVLVTYESAPGQQSAGTGFFVFRPINGDQGHVFLVTNKHVLPPEGSAKSIRIRVTTGPIEKPVIGFVEVPVIGHDGKYLPIVKLHPKTGFDVAAVNVTETIVKNGIQGAWLPLDLFSTPERLKNEGITIGDEIFLLGYPDAIFDARNASPILRTGVIATVPIEGYAFNDVLRAKYNLPDRIDGFLIDANVFPGSSGSVVILKQQPSTVGAGGGTIMGSAKKTPYVLGIVSASIPISDSALKTTQRMGLGIVFSADAIRTVIDLFPAK